MKTRSPRRAAALLLALALACSLLTVPAEAEETEQNIPLTSSKTSFPLEVEKTAVLTVQNEPEEATIDWASDDGSVTVSKIDSTSARVKAVEYPGKARVTATVTVEGEVTNQYRCTVTVDPKNVPVKEVTLNKTSLDMLTDDNEILTATVTLDDGTIDQTKTVTWKSSDKSVVTVTGGVLTTGKKTGEAKITAAVGDVESDPCFVYVDQREDISSLTVSPANIVLSKEDDPKTFTVTVTGGAVTGVANDDIIFSYSSDDVPIKTPPVLTDTDWEAGSFKATYTYKVEPKSSAVPGEDYITVTAKAKANPRYSDSCFVSIVQPSPPSARGVNITSTSTNYYVDPGSKITLTAAVEPANASALDQKITWKTSSDKIAQLESDTGNVINVKGVAPGKATITATSANGKSAEREVETSGILLSYRASDGTTKSLTESTTVDIYQYHDITVIPELFGNARGRAVSLEARNSSVASVDPLRVTGTYPGETTITATVTGTGFSTSFNVKVSEDVADAIAVNMGSSPSYSFSGLLSDLDKRSQSKAEGPLESVSSLKVSTENGALYYGYTSANSPGHGVGGSERFYYQPASQGQMAIRDVTFVPLPGFNGTAIVEYNATATNGSTFNGTIRITATSTGDVSYSTEMNQPVAFAAEHFSAVCMSRNGQNVRYINFSQPSAGRGTLYYNYSPSGQYSPKVVDSTAYYVSGSPSIDGITFVPAENYAGTVSIPYRCIDSAGASFTGTVTVTVSSSGDVSTAGDVEYSIARNQRQTLRANDFNSACQRVIGGTLDYIRFTDLPASTAGILYLNYASSSSTRVATDRSYYRNASPHISNISFVPATNYSGTVTIPFTAANTSGDTFSGTLVIHVDGGVGTVHYSTLRNRAVTFAAADFNDASRRINGTSLNYVRFTGLPSSSAGALYLNYTSSSSTRVSAGTSYYRSGSPSLSNISFVPASGYEGTVTIPFTAYDNNGDSFDGTVSVAVGNTGQTVYYATVSRGSVRFNGTDFNSACRFATGDSLSYVRFNLPSSSYGTLYYQYNSSTRTGSSVSSSTNYYYSGSGTLISNVSFAASSASGTVTFGYTGYSTGGSSFSGTVEIRVSSSAVIGTSIRYAGSSTPIAFRASDFQNLCQIALGNPLSYVQFTSLPTVGQLSQNYGGPAQSGAGVNTFTHYGAQELDQISYLPKAEYQGTLYIPYTLYDTQGVGHSSSVEIQISKDYNYSSFSDIASGYWASPSIEFLRSSGITNGYGNNTYRPAQSISRGEFTLMICRAFQFPTTGSSGFPDVPADSTYAGAIASARNLGIVEGNNGLFQPDRPITRQSAMTMICRAMDAAGQAVPAADPSLLSSYADGGQVSAFARSSVASLIQMGAVRGDTAMRINPTAAISRAEMAVILHRVLTR